MLFVLSLFLLNWG